MTSCSQVSMRQAIGCTDEDIVRMWGTRRFEKLWRRRWYRCSGTREPMGFSPFGTHFAVLGASLSSGSSDNLEFRRAASAASHSRIGRFMTEAALPSGMRTRPAPGTQVVQAYGSDIDAAMVVAASANADHAKIGPTCTWLCGDFESCVDSIPQGAVLVTNPPYGIRSGNAGEYRQLLDRFESVLVRRSDLRPVIALLPVPLWPFKPALDWRVLAKFYNGGLRVQALRLD